MTATIATFDPYNSKRYGWPWAAVVTDHGLDFIQNAMHGNETTGGTLQIENPVKGQMYAMGQKDYRNPSFTANVRAIWNGSAFVHVDKEGNELDTLGGGYCITLYTDPQVKDDTQEDAPQEGAWKTETAGLTDAEVAKAICDAAYNESAMSVAVSRQDAEYSIAYALRQKIWNSRSDNAGKLSQRYYIEYRDPTIHYQDYIRIHDGDHMEWEECYAPTLGIQLSKRAAEKAGRPFNEARQERARKRQERRRPVATFLYTMIDEDHGLVEQVDILEPERQKAEAIA